MVTRKPTKTRVCECGAHFLTTAKFGNEKFCDACYKSHQRAFLEWLDAQPLTVLVEVNELFRQICADHDIKVIDDGAQECASIVEDNPEQVPHCDQPRIDRVARKLLEGIEL